MELDRLCNKVELSDLSKVCLKSLHLIFVCDRYTLLAQVRYQGVSIASDVICFLCGIATWWITL